MKEVRFCGHRHGPGEGGVNSIMNKGIAVKDHVHDGRRSIFY